MKNVLLFCSVLLFSTLKSQCFQIQSILVDACAGSQEGQNEMVTFQVGSVPLNTSDLTVSWPNNSWLGVIQNAGTAADVASVNATIFACGFLKEPVLGILPANSKVLLITSTSWSPLAQSFANLTDTLIVIFQVAGNTAGHFANYSASFGLRTLSMNFSFPVGCNDAVTYDRTLLINQAGNAGAQDGATVEFTSAGNPTYVNNGCQAPFIPLTIDAGPNKSVCTNASQSFTAAVSGSYTSVLWSNGTGASGTFSPTNSLTTTYTPSASDNGTIKLYSTIIKACGSQTTTVKDSVSLSIIPLPTVTISPTSVSICSGQSAILLANTNTAVTYTWSTGTNTSSTSINATGIYTVTTSNTCGSSSTNINVTSSPSPSIAAASTSPSLCATGQTAILSLSGSVGTYAWSTGAATSTATINSPGIYTATVTSGNCGTAVTSITIGTLASPTISISAPSGSICSGSSVVLIANSNTGNYLWTSGATTQTVSVNSFSTVVTTTNVCGMAQATQTFVVIPLPSIILTPNNAVLCAGQSVTLQSAVNTAVTYTWSTGVTTSTIQVNAVGIYTLNVSNHCGSSSATSTITNGIGAPTATITSTSSVLCQGQNATLALTGSVGTYAWSTGATTQTINISNSGIYSATVSNSCGQALASFTVTSAALPTLQVSPSSFTLCNGNLTTITAFGSATNYTWSTGANSNTVQINMPGVYTVSLSNNCGIISNLVNITASSIPVLNINSSSYTLCPNQTATLTVTGGNEPYTWSNSPITSSVVTSSGGMVNVSSTNNCGTGTASVNIVVNMISAGIMAAPLTGTKPVVVTFTNTSMGANSYTWDFKNGQTATTFSVLPQTYNTAGNYTVSLIVSNGVCTDKRYVIITVLNEEADLIIPNVFTPNNDAVNDVFKIKGNVTDFACTIFDRWGLNLFSWDDISKGWDGKVSGNTSSDGTYFYILSARDLNGNVLNKQGAFSLFR